jgi:hydroxyacylglutathione hydrolase
VQIMENVYLAESVGNVYVVRGPSGLVMIDTTTAGMIVPSVEALEADGLDFSLLRAVLLTHMHFDHAAGTAWVRTRYGVPVTCHPLDAETVATGDRLMSAAEMYWRHTHDSMPACPVDYLVEDGDTIDVAGLSFDVIHLPGHTRGGVAYRLGDVLFTGDVMQSDGGIGWSDIHWGSNLSDHTDSLRRIRRIMPTTVCSGHGRPAAFNEGLSDRSLVDVRRLWDAGLATRSQNFAPLRDDDAERRTIVIDGLPDVPERPVGRQGRTPGERPLFEVSAGTLRGMIRPIGELHGLILSGEGGEPITQPFQATMNLEHYCETSRCGPFVPRNAVPQWYDMTDEGSVTGFGPHSDWGVSAEITYSQGAENVFDILFRFRFTHDYPRFEAFIASYFYGRRIPYVCAGGECFRPDIQKGQQLFFPRDTDAGEQVSDGRWEWLRNNGLYGETDPAGRQYDAPVTIHRDDETGWSFVQMADPDLCTAISVNTFAWAQDFSLIGRDVTAGEEIEVRARVAYARLDEPAQALDIYREFLGDRDV